MIWQIATGESGRDYRELFFNHDIMILGPSHLGDALENEYWDGKSNSTLNQVYNFAHYPQPGDKVIMRFYNEVIGIGQIPFDADNNYSFNKSFKYVYGWDLCHTRRVIWADNYKLGELANVFRHAKQKPSFTRSHEKHIVEMVQSVDSKYFDRPLKELPKIDYDEYSEDQLGIELFQKGISNKNVGDILLALKQAGRLCNWYWSKDSSGRYPSENEVISHILLPLFLGLGWSHQQIAIEWNRVDIAFFKSTPTTSDNCVMVLEAKGLGTALSDVLKQPIYYVEKLNLINTKYIITTDGANIFVYQKEAGLWNPNPVGYIAVTSLQKEYILPKGISLVDTLVMLQPSLV